MENNDADVEGALTGALVALAANWVRSENHTHRAITSANHSASHAVSLVNSLTNGGHYQRLSRPLVADALGGLLLAEQRPPMPSLAPPLNQIQRLDLASGMKSHVQGLHWPPKAGHYDEYGMATRAGDLVRLFLGMTYAESQAWNLGLLQQETPSQEQRTQIYYAANALTKVLYGTDLTFDGFVAAWRSLFQGGFTPPSSDGSNPPALSDPHNTTSTPSPPNPAAGGPPTISSTHSGLASVVALGSEVLGNTYSYVSQNTDRANKWRITVGNNTVPATASLFQVNFGSSWYRNGKPYVPIVTAQGMAVNAFNVTPSGFQVQSFIGLNPNQVLEVGFAVQGA